MIEARLEATCPRCKFKTSIPHPDSPRGRAAASTILSAVHREVKPTCDRNVVFISPRTGKKV